VPIARHARSCEHHGGGASSTRIEAPSQSAQDPHHLGWTPLSALTSLGAKRTRHVFDHFYRRHMPEVPQTSKALRYRGTSDEPSPCNPQLPMHRLRSCISPNHLIEAGRAVVSTDGNLKVKRARQLKPTFSARSYASWMLQRGIDVGLDGCKAQPPGLKHNPTCH
jgi:hypothetical protein